MRTSLVAVALVLVACGRSDRRASSVASPGDHPAAPPATPQGPDAVVLRIPRAGGDLRAFAYANLDSAIWTATDKAPAVGRLLAFDDDQGSVAIVDIRGALRRFNLRAGEVTGPLSAKLTDLTSSDGAAVYGIDAKGAVDRLTSTDAVAWTYTAPSPAREVAARPDGTIIVVGTHHSKGGTVLWHVRPPESRVLDSALLPPPTAERIVRTQLGDRVYLIADSAIEGVRGRDLQPINPIRFPRRVKAVVATPSGDRLYVALDSTTTLQVIDRYTDGPSGTVDMPGATVEMRMDPLGRYLLVRPLTGDSAWVIAVGLDHIVSTIKTAWTTDLPFVGPDGQIATAVKNDVVFVDGQTGKTRRTVVGGAKEFWIPIRWSGFRPRAANLDQPVTFDGVTRDTTDTIARAILNSQHDTSLNASATGSSPDSRPVVDTAHGGIARASSPSVGYTVQFAAVLNSEAARTTASSLTAPGRAPRVMETRSGVTTIYHVVLGPFPTHAQAEAAGRAAGHSYWVYEGTP